MLSTANAAGLTAMTDDEARGRSIEKRRLAMGHTVRSLEAAFKENAARFGGKPPSRPSIASAEDGTASDDVFERVEAWLDRVEEETGHDVSDTESQVEIRLSGNFGVDIVVKGPLSQHADLEAVASRLLREARSKD